MWAPLFPWVGVHFLSMSVSECVAGWLFVIRMGSSLQQLRPMSAAGFLLSPTETAPSQSQMESPAEIATIEGAKDADKATGDDANSQNTNHMLVVDILRWIRPDAGACTFSATEKALSPELGRGKLPTIVIPSSLFDSFLLKILLSDIQTAILTKFRECSEDLLNHIYVDLKSGQLLGKSDRILQASLKIFFVGNRVTLQKGDPSKSFAIAEICVKKDDSHLLNFPIYITADDMAGFNKSDPESCFGAAWLSRQVSDTTPTCTLGWSEEKLIMSNAVATIFNIPAFYVDLTLPYLQPEADIVQMMVERSRRGDQADMGAAVVELTRKPTADAKSRGGCGGRGGNKGKKVEPVMVNSYFGSVGTAKDFAQREAKETPEDTRRATAPPPPPPPPSQPASQPASQKVQKRSFPWDVQ